MKNNTIRIWTLIVLALALLTMIEPVNAQKTMAVLYFQNSSLFQKEEMEALSKGLADMFITELSKVEQLKVIERNRLQSLIEEMSLGQSGVVDTETAQQVGKLLGAHMLLLGSYVNNFGNKMRIDARLVEVETGKTIKAEEITGKTADLFEMVQKLATKFIKGLDLALTSEDKKRLEQTENESFDAALYYSRGLEYQDRGDFRKAYEMYKKALDFNPQYASAQTRIHEIKLALEKKLHK